VITSEKIAPHSITSQNLASDLLVWERANVATMTPTVSPPPVSPGLPATVVLTVNGISSGDLFTVTPPATLPAGLIVVSSDVLAPDTVTVRLYNASPTAATVPGFDAWTVRWLDLTD
jgi:hypothetical protein